MKKIIATLYFSFLLAACGYKQDSPVMDTNASSVPSIAFTPSAFNITPYITSTPLRTLTASTSSSTVMSPMSCTDAMVGRRVYLDENPAFAVREGPGCEYPELQSRFVKNDPLQYFDILGKQGNWLLVHSCSNNQGWIFAPSIANQNLEVNIDDLPVVARPTLGQLSSATLIPIKRHGDIDEARKTLRTFFDFLYDKNYEEAVKIFSGGYGNLIMWNPSVGIHDYSTLLEKACKQNGYQCSLRVSQILKELQISDMEYQFTIEFIRADGSIYQRKGPEEKDGLISEFVFRVVRDCNGKYVVVDWPFYEQYGG